jgi:hypothetical protein
MAKDRDIFFLKLMSFSTTENAPRTRCAGILLATGWDRQWAKDSSGK